MKGKREGMRAEEILRKHGLSADGLQQSKSGFTNALFLTEDAVVKIFTEPGGAGFQKESWFYGNIAPSYSLSENSVFKHKTSSFSLNVPLKTE